MGISLLLVVPLRDEGRSWFSCRGAPLPLQTKTLKLNKKLEPTCRGFLGPSWLQVFGKNVEERLLTSFNKIGIWEIPGKIVSV